MFHMQYAMSWELQHLPGLLLLQKELHTCLHHMTGIYMISFPCFAPCDEMFPDSVKSSFRWVCCDLPKKETNEGLGAEGREKWPAYHLSMKQTVCFRVQRFLKGLNTRLNTTAGYTNFTTVLGQRHASFTSPHSVTHYGV